MERKNEIIMPIWEFVMLAQQKWYTFLCILKRNALPKDLKLPICNQWIVLVGICPFAQMKKLLYPNFCIVIIMQSGNIDNPARLHKLVMPDFQEENSHSLFSTIFADSTLCLPFSDNWN